MNGRSTKKLHNHNRGLPSGLNMAWKLWRHCCCRNGFYPLIVAPFITASFFLDVYCTVGCGFVNLDVGFQPMNDAWSKQKMEFGLFHYQSGEQNVHTNSLMNSFHPGCTPFDSTFKEFFVEGDKTWVMSQIMGIVSGSAGGIATVVVWLMVISPIPACFLWPGILLPASLVSFLSSGAKFLFFDIEICRSMLWLPDHDKFPENAKSCTLGTDSILSIISCTLSLLCVLLVCLKAPERRNLNDGRRGIRFSDDDDEEEDDDLHNLRTHTAEESLCEGQSLDLEAPRSQSFDSKSAYDLESIHEEPKRKDDDLKKEVRNVNKEVYDPKKEAVMSTVLSHRKSLNKKLAKVRKIDQESENLRETEPSLEYIDQDFNKLMSGKSTMIPPLPETPPSKTMPLPLPLPQPLPLPFTKRHEQQYSSPSPKILRNRSHMYSPAAPSDESSFAFRSPAPPMLYGKENASPRKTPKMKKQPSHTPKKKKSTSKKKSSKPAADKTSNESQKYDEALIQKCVYDLAQSFSDSDLQLAEEDGNVQSR